MIKYSCGTYAVCIVVSEYTYALIANSGPYTLRRHVHILKVEWIAELSLARMQKLFHFLNGFCSAGIQK